MNLLKTDSGRNVCGYKKSIEQTSKKLIPPQWVQTPKSKKKREKQGKKSPKNLYSGGPHTELETQNLLLLLRFWFNFVINFM